MKRLVEESVDFFDAQSTFTRRPSDDGMTIRHYDVEYINDAMTIRDGSRRSTARQSIISNFGGPGFTFETILQQSWVYRRNERNDPDGAMSFVSSVQRSHAWSVFTGYSLADISVLSVVAMPLTLREVTNHHHYEADIVEKIEKKSALATELDVDDHNLVLLPSSTEGATNPKTVMDTAGEEAGEDDLKDDLEFDRISLSPPIRTSKPPFAYNKK